MTGNNPLHVLMTTRDRELFALLHEARLMDREQIQQLLSFGSVTRTNDRLSRLHAAGLLYRYFIGTIASGRKALYAISPRGAATIGREMVWKLHRSQNELLVGEAGIEHQLAVNWCWISMRRGPNPDLIRFARFNEPISQALALAPDGYAELRGSDGIQPVFLEVDLTTETSRVWAKKVDLYLKLATSGEFQRIFRQQRFKVAVVCTSERRLRSLRQIVRKQTTKLFYFSLLQTTKRDGFAAPHWLRPDGETRESIA
jgi:hypothetical protein